MKKSRFSTPVLFIIFNRPDTTKKVLEKIREIKPTRLFVVADGPRDNIEQDKYNVSQTRKLIDGIDWNCEVTKNYSEINLGCRNRVSSGINWFFEKVDMGIILEDDCLPNNSFFYFCEELLLKYKDQSNVMMISGNNFQDGNIRGDYSYYFSKYAHIWGWATWKRAWDRYDVNMESLNDFINNNGLRMISNSKHVQQYWLDYFRMTRDGQIDTWDYQWTYAIFRSAGLCVAPNVNLVSNIGFNNNATHTKSANNKYANMKTQEILNVNYPSYVEVDRFADNYEEKNMMNKPSVISKTKAIIKMVLVCMKN